MLFERRAYTLRPGMGARFWELQREWQTPQQIRPLIERTIGYFGTIAGPAEQIVHLYRYDSYDDWRTRLFGIYRPERAAYFSSARQLLLAQENAFYELAPVDALNPIWGAQRDWLPGSPALPGVPDATALTVVESTLDMLPGGLPVYWEAWREHGLQAGALATGQLVATLYSLVGPQHRVLQYRWYRGLEEARAHRVALEADPHLQRLTQAAAPLTVASRHTFLHPSPIPWQQSLFTAWD
jgi:hypothetical protein